jgi:hypothetical protein
VGRLNPCTAAHGTPEDKRRKLVQVLWLVLGFCQRQRPWRWPTRFTGRRVGGGWLGCWFLVSRMRECMVSVADSEPNNIATIADLLWYLRAGSTWI